MKTLLFIIDMQNDFCSPSGSLYVPGAQEDVQRLSRFIHKKTDEINHIVLTQDSHQVTDIAHPAFWINKENQRPAPFSAITYEDLEEEKWMPVIYPEEAKKYLSELKKAGLRSHTIWPEHCIWGSKGAAIHPVVMEEVIRWARKGRLFDIVIKGTHPLSEHYGAFQAEVPVTDAKETQFNHSLLEKLRAFDKIWIAGEAKSHCVANTIRQLFDYPDIMRKLIILENCMSDIPGSETLSASVCERAREMGAAFDRYEG
ncbi:MAG: isochorismatase family protein [Candidatus Azobacteroides sp.]|nr:isochorismatase family protein [Candidatus Azobacteroides sp.]